MFLMNNDFFDNFDVSFVKKEGIVGGKTYPLGYFANEILELNTADLREISAKVISFKYEFNIFLNSRDVTSAGRAYNELTALWSLISKLSVYRLVSQYDNKIEYLIRYMREHSDEVSDMMTRGTERNQMLNLWLYNIENLVPSIQNFIYNTNFMLENYFENLPSRTPENYVKAYANYTRDIKNGYDLADQEDESTEELDKHLLTFPFTLTFKPKIHPKTKEPFLAEVITFGTLESFLYTDLMKAISVGNIPRRCHNCKKYFLAVGGYDTVYCKRVAPNEKTKTCRQVGAHKKEKEKNASDFVRYEYSKAYNRLKTRKNRGKISPFEWNEKVNIALDLKEKALKGKIPDASYKMKLDKL